MDSSGHVRPRPNQDYIKNIIHSCGYCHKRFMHNGSNTITCPSCNTTAPGAKFSKRKGKENVSS